MKCLNCDVENSQDAPQCVECGAPLGDPNTPPPAQAPSQGSQVGRLFGIGAAVFALIVGVIRFADRTRGPEIEVIEMAPPVASQASSVDPRALRTEPGQRPLTESERALAGTWVARVGLNAPRPATSRTVVGIGLLAPTEPCLWLELYENLRGFQYECGVVAGEPSVLAATDPATGRQRDVGVEFSWRHQDGAVRLSYEEDLAVGQVRLREVALELPVGTSPFTVTVSFPGNDGLAPQQHLFEVFPQRYLDD